MFAAKLDRFLAGRGRMGGVDAQAPARRHGREVVGLDRHGCILERASVAADVSGGPVYIASARSASLIQDETWTYAGSVFSVAAASRSL